MGAEERNLKAGAVNLDNVFSNPIKVSTGMRQQKPYCKWVRNTSNEGLLSIISVREEIGIKVTLIHTV